MPFLWRQRQDKLVIFSDTNISFLERLQSSRWPTSFVVFYPHEISLEQRYLFYMSGAAQIQRLPPSPYQRVTLGPPIPLKEVDWIYSIDEEQLGIIYLPTATDLTCQVYMSGLSAFFGNVEVGRRSLVDWLETQIFSFGGRFIWCDDGNFFEFKVGLDDIAEAFDGADRWFSDFLRYHERPWKQKPQAKVVFRLLYLALARSVKTYRLGEMVRRVQIFEE